MSILYMCIYISCSCRPMLVAVGNSSSSSSTIVSSVRGQNNTIPDPGVALTSYYLYIYIYMTIQYIIEG